VKKIFFIEVFLFANNFFSLAKDFFLLGFGWGGDGEWISITN